MQVFYLPFLEIIFKEETNTEIKNLSIYSVFQEGLNCLELQIYTQVEKKLQTISILSTLTWADSDPSLSMVGVFMLMKSWWPLSMPATHQSIPECCIKRQIVRRIEFGAMQGFCKADAGGCHKDISRDSLHEQNHPPTLPAPSYCWTYSGCDDTWNKSWAWAAQSSNWYLQEKPCAIVRTSTTQAGLENTGINSLMVPFSEPGHGAATCPPLSNSGLHHFICRAKHWLNCQSWWCYNILLGHVGQDILKV